MKFINGMTVVRTGKRNIFKYSDNYSDPRKEWTGASTLENKYTTKMRRILKPSNCEEMQGHIYTF
jgi:hypothetical protein